MVRHHRVAKSRSILPVDLIVMSFISPLRCRRGQARWQDVVVTARRLEQIDPLTMIEEAKGCATADMSVSNLRLTPKCHRTTNIFALENWRPSSEMGISSHGQFFWLNQSFKGDPMDTPSVVSALLKTTASATSNNHESQLLPNKQTSQVIEQILRQLRVARELYAPRTFSWPVLHIQWMRTCQRLLAIALRPFG
jgi:hypothetical protein